METQLSALTPHTLSRILAALVFEYKESNLTSIRNDIVAIHKAIVNNCGDDAAEEMKYAGVPLEIVSVIVQ